MRWDNNKVPREIIAMAIDEMILKGECLDEIKNLEKVARKSNKSIYEIMEFIVDNMIAKGYYKFN